MIDHSAAIDRTFHVHDETNCGIDERASVFDAPAGSRRQSQDIEATETVEG